ncbi:MAG: IPT/TIG domain-containing protein [Planctomycetes bacterium]|nr:IPT/TIG domain-containing protein [Planctomycetota bacterium]
MIHRTLTACALSVLVLGLVATGCSNKSSRQGGNAASAVTSTTTSTTSTTTNSGPALTRVDPTRGNPYGGTVATLSGRGFLPGSTVLFDGVAATQVQVFNEARITCETPAHAAGAVDVEVVLPSGARLLLAGAFDYDPTAGPFGRVANTGAPTPEEHELLELINRARRDPPAEGVRLGLDFSQIAARPPLTHDGLLGGAATAHTLDMATRAFYGHTNPNGVGPVGRVLDAGYALHSRYGTNRASNTIENVGAASGNLLDTPQKVHDAFMIDAGVNPPKHRELILGIGNFKGRRQAGFGYRVKAPTTFIYDTFVTEDLAASSRDLPLVLGTAFVDTTNDGLARAGEGVAGIVVTLTHRSGFSLTTTTNAVGAFGFEVYSKGAWTVTLDGKQAQIVIAADNVKVDLVNGVARTY